MKGLINHGTRSCWRGIGKRRKNWSKERKSQANVALKQGKKVGLFSKKEKKSVLRKMDQLLRLTL